MPVSLLSHFRISFSFLLMPVFLLALATAPRVQLLQAGAAFLILHLLVYPSSNAYNSLQDQDTGPIGGIEHPQPVPAAVGKLALVTDALALVAALWVHPVFAACLLAYITLSRLYSYRGIRLKKYPFLGYLTVVLSQGALTYYMSTVAISGKLQAPFPGLFTSTLLLGAFYPITQIYQHEQDSRDGVRTLSALLGVKGTFIYCAAVYSLAFLVLGYWFSGMGRWQHFLILLVFLLPVAARFSRWAWRCFQHPRLANYNNTMRMAWRAAAFTNLGFFILYLLQHPLG